MKAEIRKPLGVRATEEQHQLIAAAAKLEHRSINSFVLVAALKSAESILALIPKPPVDHAPPGTKVQQPVKPKAPRPTSPVPPAGLASVLPEVKPSPTIAHTKPVPAPKPKREALEVIPHASSSLVDPKIASAPSAVPQAPVAPPAATQKAVPDPLPVPTEPVKVQPKQSSTAVATSTQPAARLPESYNPLSESYTPPPEPFKPVAPSKPDQSHSKPASPESKPAAVPEAKPAENVSFPEAIRMAKERFPDASPLALSIVEKLIAQRRQVAMRKYLGETNETEEDDPGLIPDDLK